MITKSFYAIIEHALKCKPKDLELSNLQPRFSARDIFCSKTTLKILKVLKKGDRLNTSEITRMIRSNFADTASHLRLLEEQEILAHSNFGVRSSIYRFAESPRARAVKELLEAWEQETEHF